MDKYKPSWEETHNEYADSILTDPALHPANTPDDIAKLKYAHALFTGEIREPDKGFWGELSDEAKLSWNRGWRGIYNTFGSDENVKRLDDELRINPEWMPPEERGILGEIGGVVGGFCGHPAVVFPSTVILVVCCIVFAKKIKNIFSKGFAIYKKSTGRHVDANAAGRDCKVCRGR